MVPEEPHKVEIRPVTKEDLVRFYKGEPYPTMKAWLAIVDDEDAGISGLAYLRGLVVAFMDLRDNARPCKLAMMGYLKRGVYEAKEKHRVIFAVEDQNEPTAPRLLKALGFEKIDDGLNNWRWIREN